MDTKQFLDSEYVKANINTKDGDHLKFLNEGRVSKSAKGEDGLEIDVEILRNDELLANKKFSVNKGNNKAVAAIYGYDSKKWIGKEMRVNVVKKQNPQTGGLVDSVVLSAPNTDEENEAILT